MHTTFEHTHPEDQADDHVRRDLDHPHAVHGNQHDQAGCRQQQGHARQLAGVEHRNHDDRPQVVDNRQGHQKQLERHRHTLAQQSQHAESESNIRGHRDGPAAECVRVILVDKPVDQCRYHHAANGRRAGQHHLRGLGQLAFEQFALDLQADQQKEQGHQAIVDPQQRRLGNLQGADLHRYRHVQKGRVVMGKR